MVASLTITLLLGLAVVGVTALVASVRSLHRRARDRVHGELIAVDDGRRRNAPLISHRYRLVGRPDSLRRTRDGRIVPIEIKSRTSPPNGPPLSHVVQVWAYCLLVEETTDVPVPYGVLRYSDGGEFRIDWGEDQRQRLLALRREVALPYDGRARPSPRRCAGCRYRYGCDVRAA
ncbi:MAG TPA: PD-(D/E)XK nuclease family protein [Thermoplasmata archaeon]|nr:PD-(D/E)XK nuclease family protein [Thermoplasmata archaeon]